MKLKLTVDILFTLAFIFIAIFVDFKIMESRVDSPLYIQQYQVKTFLYIMHAWFFIGGLAGITALGFVSCSGAYLYSPLNLIDFVLAIMGLVKVDFMASLNILKVFKIVKLISMHPRMEFLKEILQLITESIGLLASSLSIMIICTLFMAMLINNIVVGNLQTG
jgi:hypothetical protein